MIEEYDCMNLIIVGATKIGSYLAEHFDQFRLRHTVIGYVDDNPNLLGKEIAGLPVLGNIEYLFELKKIAVVLAVQDPNQKIDIVRRLHSHPAIDFPNLFSNNTWVSRDCIFGKGNLILGGSLINFGTMIGNFNSINQNCSIGHESVIQNFCNLEESVNFGGYSILEDEGVVGKEAVIAHGVRIGRDAKIAPKAQIEADVPSKG
jgi:sugar O-acyltransferase (sialic acid O-acetyltransferase NeuD family)